MPKNTKDSYMQPQPLPFTKLYKCITIRISQQFRTVEKQELLFVKIKQNQPGKYNIQLDTTRADRPSVVHYLPLCAYLR